MNSNVVSLIRSCRYIQDAYREPQTIWKQSIENGIEHIDETSRQLEGQVQNKKLLIMRADQRELFKKMVPNRR